MIQVDDWVDPREDWQPGQQGKGFIFHDGGVITWPTKEWIVLITQMCSERIVGKGKAYLYYTGGGETPRTRLTQEDHDKLKAHNPNLRVIKSAVANNGKSVVAGRTWRLGRSR